MLGALRLERFDPPRKQINLSPLRSHQRLNPHARLVQATCDVIKTAYHLIEKLSLSIKFLHECLRRLSLERLTSGGLCCRREIKRELL